MPTTLISRPARQCKRIPVLAVLLAAQFLLGLLVLVLWTLRVVATLAVTTTRVAEDQLAARTGRPALSDTGIAAICAAFVDGFLTAYRAPAR